MRVSVFGLGYVGCVSAASFAGDGHEVVGVDVKRRRISLAPEGSQIEGTRGDYQAYVKQQRKESEREGFHALAAALSKIKPADQRDER